MSSVIVLRFSCITMGLTAGLVPVTHTHACACSHTHGKVMTGNILYLSLITWVSLTSIKEMEHLPDEFKVGRWS